MKEIDARGYECPMPVIMAKRFIDKDLDEFKVYVDNKIATENLDIMANETGYLVEITKISEENYEVIFKVNKDYNMTLTDTHKEFIIVIDSDVLGRGDRDLGKILIENYIFTLTEQEKLPKYIILYNSGVFLSTKNDQTVSDLLTLSHLGVEVISCGLCLDYYELSEKLRVGSTTNMYRISKLMADYKVVSI